MKMVQSNIEIRFVRLKAIHKNKSLLVWIASARSIHVVGTHKRWKSY